MLSYGCYSLIVAVRNPSLKLFLAEGGSEVVAVCGYQVTMNTRLFVALIYLTVLALIAGGLWLCDFAYRGRGNHGG